MRKIAEYIRHPGLIVGTMGRHGFLGGMSDRKYLEIVFKGHLGYPLNLDDPKTFNEKLQWLKIHDRNPQYKALVDKYEVRKYVAVTVGEEFLIPIEGGPWNSAEDIDFEKLPDAFVIKCTHDSGSVVICKDKARLNKRAVREKLGRNLKRDFYYGGREWAYKDVTPRIIAERYMTDETGEQLKDYKFFCFYGIPMFIQVDFDRFTNHRRNMYTPSWTYLDFALCYPTDPSLRISKPENLNQMLKIAEQLSAGIPHVRVDLYSINGRIYFGELTLYHGSGLEKFTPPEWDRTMGNLLGLPTGNTTSQNGLHV